QSEGFRGVIEVQVPETQDILSDESAAPIHAASNEAAVQRARANALQIHAPRTGDYDVVVRTTQRGEQGRYVLSVQKDSRDIKDVSLSDAPDQSARILLRPDRKTRGQL